MMAKSKYGSMGVWECGSVGVWECVSANGQRPTANGQRQPSIVNPETLQALLQLQLKM